MFAQTFKNIDDILHKDAGCGSELDYVEQTSWALFLKYLDDLERDKALAAERTGKTYKPIISDDYKWDVWAAPKGPDGKLDHNNRTGGRRPHRLRKRPPFFLKIKLRDGKERDIKHMMSTSFWGADGKPLTAAEFSRNSLASCPNSSTAKPSCAPSGATQLRAGCC